MTKIHNITKTNENEIGIYIYIDTDKKHHKKEISRYFYYAFESL